MNPGFEAPSADAWSRRRSMGLEYKVRLLKALVIQNFQMGYKENPGFLQILLDSITMWEEIKMGIMGKLKTEQVLDWMMKFLQGSINVARWFTCFTVFESVSPLIQHWLRKGLIAKRNIKLPHYLNESTLICEVIWVDWIRKISRDFEGWT